MRALPVHRTSKCRPAAYSAGCPPPLRRSGAGFPLWRRDAYRRRAGADRQRRQGSGRPANLGHPRLEGRPDDQRPRRDGLRKPMFRRSMAAQRCVIPATSFYEWDAARHKYQFALPGEPLYLAGLYDNVDGANRFVILTTTPNASMHGIHDRMPLILRRDQIRPWLTDAESALHLLAAPPPLLERHSTDGQMSFGDLL